MYLSGRSERAKALDHVDRLRRRVYLSGRSERAKARGSRERRDRGVYLSGRSERAKADRWHLFNEKECI